jgi:hypothetical protein
MTPCLRHLNTNALSARFNARFNYACCLALCGREGEAAALLAALLACDGTTAAEVAADPALAGRPWVARLLAS